MKPHEIDADRLMEFLGDYILKNHSELHMSEMTRRCVEDFNRTVEKAEAAETDMKVRQIIGDTWGHRTYMVEVERG